MAEMRYTGVIDAWYLFDPADLKHYRKEWKMLESVSDRFLPTAGDAQVPGDPQGQGVATQ